jgi:hypothetical protein
MPMIRRKNGMTQHGMAVLATIEHGIYTFRLCGPWRPRPGEPIADWPIVHRSRWPGADKPHNWRRQPKRRNGVS